MPDPGPLAYLVELLREVGEAQQLGEGLTVTSWAEIAAWASATETALSPGEMAALRSLSAAYVSQYYESLDPACPPPSIQKTDAATVEKKIGSMFDMLRSQKQ